MDKVEAKEILAQQISRLRALEYSELCRLIKDPEQLEVTSESGAWYQLEIQAWWDDKSEHNLRVLVSIDDGGWRAIVPLTDDFIIAPDGSFVGE
jgi:hypothetical protein